jgi:hypothetical protein
MEVDVSFSVFDITVPVMVHGLNVMDNYLDHARALERTKGFEPGRILTERLAPDMITFGEQFSVSCNKVDAHMAKLMQRDPPAPRDMPMMYPALKGRLLETRGFLQNVQPDEIAGAQSHTYELIPSIVRGWFGGEDYIRHLVLPDFFFHISIAHAILRPSERRSGSATISATSLNIAAVTTRERRARCTARADEFDVMVFGPLFRVKVHFSGAILRVGPAERTGKS